jgi:hypothetical protein
MNTYQERFKQHPLQGSLDALQTAIERVRLANQSVEDETVFAESNEVQRAAFARLFRVATFMSNSVKSCDASIWTQAAMTAAQTAVMALTAAIEQYEASKSVALFEAAGDTALDHFRNASISRFSTTAKDAEDAFFKFCEGAEAGIGSIEGVNRSIKEKEQEIIAARDKFQSQIAELGTQLESFKTQFEAQKTRVDELVASQSLAFQTTQTERTTAFTQEAETRKTTYTLESETRKTTFDQWSKDSAEKFEKLLTDSKSDAALNLAKMNEHLDRAKEILGIVAASVVGGHYKETAERDFKSANIYRRLALAFFVIMAGMIAYVVLSVNGNGFSWEMGLFRVGVGMALLIPAYYCAKESSKHREAERRNRRLQIELATIEPYLEKLDNPDEMKAILKEKANSYFMGQVPREPDDDMEARISGKEWKRREEQFMEMVKTLGSAFKK